MSSHSQSRRRTLKTLAAISALAGVTGSGTCMSAWARTGMQEPVPWTKGTEHASLKMPADATDCHHHIYDHRYPLASGATLKPGDATVDDYRRLQRRLGTSRNVVIQPSSYGTDNRLLLASIAAFNGRARGIAVVDDTVSQAELEALHRGGVRGIRFNVVVPGPATVEMIEPLAQRIAPMGWHVQVNASAATILSARQIWYRLPCPVVFDHLAHIPEPDALTHPAFHLVTDLLAQGKAYVKLTGFYNESTVGAPTYSDSVAVAAAYARAAPQQVVWGSDWPHPTEQPLHRIPDDALLLDLLAKAVPDEGARNRILVGNPTTLYHFG
ncbi:MAG: amidohydrolase family protein [Pseudomonadota bacterium]|jgi:predicted TIM-barrel fold metal-dependent hydrolase|uniref:amidohydrolase family protein n=1 Tax=Paraburkholderia TaxID=1822464 RepID=UPI00048871DB|nr:MULTISPECIES: amidohydrolase family protein [Paraburkholderia]PNE56667.1 2-pyrone-4,6-dicarboxylate hydrolase [Paraburkholderia fungorum]USU14500.1 amidohydrolase family protein [Paraburkholderia fungorum]USU22448.1 amidohydrolase family protein [Paraburkholderia fungorum]